MPSPFLRAPIAPLVLIVLSACSSAPPPPTSIVLPEADAFTSRTELPEDGAVALQGQARIARIRREPAQGLYNGSISEYDEYMGPGSAAIDGTMVITYENGQPVATHLAAGDRGFAIDTRQGDEFSTEDSYWGQIMWGGPNEAAARFVRPSALGMDHMSYGRWMADGTDTGATVGVGAYGANTPEAAMPVSGEATYRGKGFGYYDQELGGINVTDFDITMSTSDFRTVRIESSNTLIANQTHNDESVYVDDLNFSGTGTISGSRVTADITSADLAGTADGQFFGSGAEEFGGTFMLEAGDTTHIGAFGASR
ncbi:transferrin-binding protein-like solute binding protein [Shimia sp. MIT1388]|uniref:transferrin-binding protein-like solute binding protein n=1 Tax=Shimia sp. MIT1388 TaxID=3096992 RepID=UPI00399AEFCD